MLSNFKTGFSNTYETIFQKRLVSKKIMNTRFQSDLTYGQSIARVIYDISNVRVRSVTRGAASTIDPVVDSTELLLINLEKEAVFHISDGEKTQAGPLNPSERIGKDMAKKVSIDLDARCFAEVRNALTTFDTGDLTTANSNGTPIVLNATNVPQLVSRVGAKLSNRYQQDNEDMVMVADSYAASDITQYLLGKNIDLAGTTFKNGYSGPIGSAEMYISENLTGEIIGTTSGNFTAGEQLVFNGGTTLTAVSTIGATPGNFLIGGSAAATLVNLAGLINNPGTTSANQVALSASDQLNFTDTLKLSATTTATTIDIVGIGSGRMAFSETGAAFSAVNFINAYFGKRGAIDLVVQSMKMVDLRETADRRGTNVFNSYLAGIKTFADGAKMFARLLLAA